MFSKEELFMEEYPGALPDMNTGTALRTKTHTLLPLERRLLVKFLVIVKTGLSVSERSQVYEIHY